MRTEVLSMNNEKTVDSHSREPFEKLRFLRFNEKQSKDFRGTIEANKVLYTMLEPEHLNNGIPRHFHDFSIKRR